MLQKKNLMLWVLLLLIDRSSILAQKKPSNTVPFTVEKNIRYGQPKNASIKSKYYLLDLYRPQQAAAGKVPLIIMMHGGGFKLGSKKSNSTPVFSRSFAGLGFVCASINYRLSKKKPLGNFKDMAEGCFDALQDLQQAKQFLIQNADKFGIDTNHIMLAGNSAGGMMALQAVYSSPKKLTAIFDSAAAGHLSDTPFLQQITAVVNCWGGIYDSAWMAKAGVPVVSVHGGKDRVVQPIFTPPSLFGSIVVHRVLAQSGTPNAVKIYGGAGHELARPFNPFWAGPASRKRCRSAAIFIADFLRQQIVLSRTANAITN
jgi:acetyl esterase/lipase